MSQKQVYKDALGDPIPDPTDPTKDRYSDDAVITFLDTLFDTHDPNEAGEYTDESKFGKYNDAGELVELGMSDLEKEFNEIFETLIVNQWDNEFRNVGKLIKKVYFCIIFVGLLTTRVFKRLV